MEDGEALLNSESKEKIVLLFSDFMSRVAVFEELVAVGNRFLVSFQRGLEFIRRPPIDETTELLKQIIKVNETQRLRSYISAGWMNTHDSADNLIKLHACQVELWNNLYKAKYVIRDLESLVEDLTAAIGSTTNVVLDLEHEDNGSELDSSATSYSKEKAPPDPQTPKVTDYGTMVAAVYSMVKLDFVMQEKIVLSLGLTTSSGELESFCLLWSLRPYVDDEIMRQAWGLTP